VALYIIKLHHLVFPLIVHTVLFETGSQVKDVPSILKCTNFLSNEMPNLNYRKVTQC